MDKKHVSLKLLLVGGDSAFTETKSFWFVQLTLNLHEHFTKFTFLRINSYVAAAVFLECALLFFSPNLKTLFWLKTFKPVQNFEFLSREYSEVANAVAS